MQSPEDRLLSRLNSKADSLAAGNSLNLDADDADPVDSTPDTFADYCRGVRNLVVDGPADRCLATVAAMQELTGFGFSLASVKRYAGTQMGSLVCALLAMGTPLEAVRGELSRLTATDFSDPVPPVGGCCVGGGGKRRVGVGVQIAGQYSMLSGELFRHHIRQLLSKAWASMHCRPHPAQPPQAW